MSDRQQAETEKKERRRVEIQEAKDMKEVSWGVTLLSSGNPPEIHSIIAKYSTGER